MDLKYTSRCRDGESGISPMYLLPMAPELALATKSPLLPLCAFPNTNIADIWPLLVYSLPLSLTQILQTYGRFFSVQSPAAPNTNIADIWSLLFVYSFPLP